MCSRSAPFPRWYGEAEMLTITSAPASATSLAGGPGSQMSSQIVSPRVVPLIRATAGVSPTWKYRCSSNTP